MNQNLFFTVFDFQSFIKNKSLEAVIQETERDVEHEDRELFEEELGLVAGGTECPAPKDTYGTN